MKLLTSKCQPGDLFYIPAINKNGESGIVIARYIELMHPNVGHIIEIFQKHYKRIPQDLADIDLSKRLLRPIMFDMYFKDIPRWRILFSDSTYEKSQSDYTHIAFAFYSDAWVGGKTIKASSSELKNMESATCWTTEQLIFLVNAYLAELFNANEEFWAARLSPENRLSNPAVHARIIELAKTIDRQAKLLIPQKNSATSKSSR